MSDFYLGEDIWCEDKSDSNKLVAKDGKCPTGATRCTGNLIRPLPARCQQFIQYASDYPEDYEDFDFDSECIPGAEICIEKDSTSKCDLHPQCVDGEDENEDECKEEYIRKEIVQPTETFKCKFPNYTFVNSNWTLYPRRAIRCDGDPTCPNGEDEEGCKILAETIKYILRK